jgi:hypothetical protein
LFNNSRPLEGGACRQIWPPIDGRFSPAGLSEPDAAMGPRRSRHARGRSFREFGLRHDAHSLEVQSEETHRRVVPAEIIFALVMFVEGFDEGREVGDRRKRGHGERAPLALVHHVDSALHHHVLRRHTLVGEALGGLMLQRLEGGLDGVGIRFRGRL